MWFSLSDGRYHGSASVELFSLGRAESKLRNAEGETLCTRRETLKKQKVES